MQQLDVFSQTSGKGLIAGVDEVGRGPLAGDVVASAVILNPDCPVDGLADSKKLSEKHRRELAVLIKQSAISWYIARASVSEIDELNILHASMLAMKRAVQGMSVQPDHVQVDGNRCPVWDYSCEAIVKGDSKIACISAASILAKVTRDEEMVLLDQQYPGYGFAAHKGYPTKVHMELLRKLGPCDIHRRSYKPVQELLK